MHSLLALTRVLPLRIARTMSSTISGCQITWKISPDELSSRTSSLIKKTRDLYDSVVSAEPSWESTVQKLALFDAEYCTERSVLDFPQHVHPDKTIRDASVEAERLLSDFEVELEMRKDLFDKFVIIQSSGATMPAEMQRYLDRKVRDGKRNGLHLDEEGRTKIEVLSKEENRLCIDFSHALNEENTLLEFKKEELAGCPEDFISGLKNLPNGKLQVSLKYPHYFPISEKATNPETRRKMEVAFNSRCMSENRPILKRLMALRKERSAALGFPTHADFQLDIRMAKRADTVAKFLVNVSQKLEPLRLKETARVMELKKEECERLGLPFDNRINPWDFRYYMNLSKEKDFSVDQQVLKQYFPLKSIKAGILRLYQQLLGVTFAQVETQDSWHPDVEMYSVVDTNSKVLMGYFFLDLHPRPGKYGHAAVFGLQPGCLRMASNPTGQDQPTTERQCAVAAMVANFTGPTTEQPHAYLLHDEVETFFHEFGHLMHALCARTDTAMFSGTRVETDFVECPSQMLENWVWTEEGLKALMGDTGGGSMPRELLDKLLASRTANAGWFYARQVCLASFDQAIHTDRSDEDPQDVFVELSRKLLGIEPSPGTCMPATFNHMAGGYDSRYYGYMWSLVFSADLYETRFRHAPDGGCLSPSVGREYREKILQPGGSKDAVDMLRDFLGRDPNDKAFFCLLGVDA